MAQSTEQTCPPQPVQSGCSARVVVVAQKVDGLAVQFLLPKFDSLLPSSLRECLQFSILQQVEEWDRVVKTVHEQHVVLFAHL